MIIVRVVVCIVVIAIGGSVMMMLEKSITIDPPKSDSVAAQRVVVVKVARVDVRRQWRGYGTAKAMDVADVPSRVTSTVTNIDAALQIGKVVDPIDTLVTLDASDFEKHETTANQKKIELTKQLVLLKIEADNIVKRRLLAQEDVALAQSEHAKIEKFVKGDAAERRELDAARRAVLAAKRMALEIDEAAEKIVIRRLQIDAQLVAQTSQLELAQLNKQRCVIHSPIAGVIEKVDVDNGENIAVGQRVVRVVSLQRIEVALQLPAGARQDIVVGSHVLLEATNDSGLQWKSAVTRVSPIDNTDTRTFTVYVEVKQPDALAAFGNGDGHQLLVPGMFVEGRASSPQSQARWVVPRRAIRNGRLLAVGHENKIESLKVKIDFVREGNLPQFGLVDDQWAVLAEQQVNAGGNADVNRDSSSAAKAHEQRKSVLEEGQLILVNGSATVRDGQRVEPVLSDKQSSRSSVPATSDSSLATATVLWSQVRREVSVGRLITEVNVACRRPNNTRHTLRQSQQGVAPEKGLDVATLRRGARQ